METTDHPLSGVYLKIERALKHISDYHDAGQAFLDDRPCEIIRLTNPTTGTETMHYGEIKTPPPGLSLFVGDTIHNLRASLDLLACQIIKLRDPLHDCEHTFFPISESSVRFESVLQTAEAQQLGERALQILQDIQPFKGGKGHALWQIHRLDIQDKHRLLIVVTAGTKHFDTVVTPHPNAVSDESPRPVEIYAMHVPEGETMVIPKKGDPIITIRPGDYLTDGDLEVSGKFTIDVAFGESQIMQPQSVYHSLRAFAQVVIETVAKFESLFSETENKPGFV